MKSRCSPLRYGFSSCLRNAGRGFSGGMVLNHGFERDDALCEVTHSQHVFAGHTTGVHLADTTHRYAQMRSQGGCTATFCIKPSFEVHIGEFSLNETNGKASTKPVSFSLC